MAVAKAKQKPSEKRRPLNIEEAANLPVPAADATGDDKADYVVSRFAVQDDHYRGLYQLWTKVLLFLAGKHWLKWNEKQAVYESDTDVPPWRQQPVTNLTYAILRTAIAKMTKQRPTMEVVPPSGDSDDRDSAEIGHALLEHYWRLLKTPQLLVRALGWFLSTGNVFFNPAWDDEAGPAKPRVVLVEVLDPNDPTGTATIDVECACDEDGEAYRRQSTGPVDLALDGGDPYDLEREPDLEPEGEQVLEIDDPFSVRFNPDATSAEDAEEWFIGKLAPKQAVADQYHIDVTLLGGDQDDAAALREDYDNVQSAAAAAAPDLVNALGVQSGADQSDAIGERTLVIHYFRKPCAREGYPKGRHWIVAGRRKVWPPEPGEDGNKHGEYPNGEAELPFGFWPPRVPLIDTPIPGQPQGLGMLTQVVPLNEQLNHLDGKISEYHVTMAMGGIWWAAPEDKGIQITTEPGQVRISKAMGAGKLPPQQAKMNPLPTPVYAERDVIQQKLRMVAGVSEIDMGQRPQGVSAGRAFLVIQEASDAAIMPAINAMESALEEIGRRQLIIAQQKVSAPRTIAIRGDKGQWEYRAFKGADLRDGLDVRVQAGSAFPWSKSAQWDTKLSVLQALPSLILNEQGVPDKQKVSQYLDAGAAGLAAFTSDEDPDLIEIQREHAMFEAYNPDEGRLELPQLGFWQAHAIHQEYHFAFLKRDYARFLRWHPKAQQAFLAHCQETTATLTQMIAAMTPTAGAEGGAPPEGEGEAAISARSPEDPSGLGPEAKSMRLGAGDRAAAGV